MEKMKDAVNAAAGGDGIPTRRIAGDAGREYILQTEEDTKAKAALNAGTPCHVCMPACQQQLNSRSSNCRTNHLPVSVLCC